MKAVVQRVQHASVTVGGNEVSSIGPGLLTLIGIAKGDKDEQMRKLIQKIVNLRIFGDENDKMNLSLLDTKGEHLIVSQFTLLGDCSKGRRPFFNNAEEPSLANELYEKSLAYSIELGVKTLGGQFAADMKVNLLNDGPVTLTLET